MIYKKTNHLKNLDKQFNEFLEESGKPQIYNPILITKFENGKHSTDGIIAFSVMNEIHSQKFNFVEFESKDDLKSYLCEEK